MFLTRLLSTFFLSLALSVDDLVVGVSYGLQKIRIPFKTLLLIVTGSTVSMYVSMLIGKFAISFLNDTTTKILSFLLLTCLGCWVMVKAWHESKETGLIRKTTYSKCLGCSDPLGIWEALYLGAALGIDDFAEALGLAVAGFPILLTVFLFKLSEVIAIYTGSLLGEKELSKFINAKLAFIPGVALIVVGIWQLV